VTEIADAIRSILENADLKETLIRNGKTNIKNASWKKSTGNVLLDCKNLIADVYR
jgi:hypothetical protein